MASRMARPARTARSASSSCVTGSAEGSHHRIPDELLDGAAAALDLLPQAGVVGADAGAYILGVLALGGGGESDEVAERTETTLRSSWTGTAGRSINVAEQKPQNWKPSGFSLPQAGQITRLSLGPRRQANNRGTRKYAAQTWGWAVKDSNLRP